MNKDFFTLDITGEFGDLAIWGGLSLILAAFYIVCAIKTRQRNADNDGEAI